MTSSNDDPTQGSPATKYDEKYGAHDGKDDERAKRTTPSETDTIQAPEGHGEDTDKAGTAEERVNKRDFGIVPIPKYLRVSKESPPRFDIFLNILFGVASTFIVSNLYYCQPLLIQLSHTFGVSYDEVSHIPTLIQAGYASGLLLITPLGDLVRRRALILVLIIFTGALSIGLPLTSSLHVFEGLSFLIGFGSVVPQILMPFAADLAPPEKRASALAIVLSGLLFGILFARVVAGVIANFVTWRVVYWLSVGLQGGILVLLYFKLPDFPPKNKNITYFGILWTMAKFAVTEPLLIQMSLINIASMACFINFWVTLTFLLGGPIYNYSTLVIGLFGLLGMGAVATSPFLGKLVDRMVPWYGTLISTFGQVLFFAIDTAAAGLNISVVIIVCLGMDSLRQLQQVSTTTAVFGLEPSARARLNAVLIISIFIGQIMGTAVGTELFNNHGWRAAAAASLGWQGFALLVLLARGPHCARYTWFGYEGGFAWRKGSERPQEHGALPAGEQRQRDEETGEANATPALGEGGVGDSEKVTDSRRESTEVRR